MESLYNALNWELMICESFVDSRLYQAARDVKDCGTNWKKLFEYRAYVAWDKIPSSDIEEYEQRDVDKLLKQIRRIKLGYEERLFVLFAFKDEHTKYIYYDEELCELDRRYKDFTWYSKDGRYKMSQTEMFNNLKDCDYILKVYIDKYMVVQLKLDRAASIKGSWQMSDKDHKTIHTAKAELGKSGGGIIGSVGTFYAQCNSMAKEARKRWKEILAERKFSNNDTAEVDKLVENVMARLPKACMNATKDPTKYDNGRLEKLMKLVYDKYSSTGSGAHYYTTGKDELLVTYQKLCQAIMDMKRGDSVWLDRDMTMKNIEQYKKMIQDKCKVIDEQLKYFGA